MRNELWKVATGLALSEEEFGKLEFVPAISGSPYDEAVKEDEHRFAVNPYIRYGGVLEALLRDEGFMRSSEGQILFQEAVSRLLDIDRVQGIDKNFFLKKWMEEEILSKHFGEASYQFYQMLTVQEQKRTVENLVYFYQQRQTVTAFVREVTALYPKSLVFQKKDDTGHIYIYMGMPKSRERVWQLERCKELFLPMEMQLHIAWEEAFLLTDLQEMEEIGKCIV